MGCRRRGAREWGAGRSWGDPGPGIGGGMKPSSRSDVAPFHVMDVLAAAHERQRTHGDALFLCAGGVDARAAEGPDRGGPGHRRGSAGLHGGDGHPGAEAHHRGAPQRPLRGCRGGRGCGGGVVGKHGTGDRRTRGDGGRRGDHDRFVRRFRGAVPGRARRRRRHRARAARLPGIPERAAGARRERGGNRLRAGDPVPADRRAAGGAAAGAEGGHRHQPRQPHRHHHRRGRTGTHRAMVRSQRRAAHQRRDLPRHFLRPRMRQRASSATKRWSSAASASTTR